MKTLFPRFLVIFVCLFAVLTADAQSHRLVPVGHPAYRYLSRLQHRGELLALPPMALPYTRGAILEALEGLEQPSLGELETIWVRKLEDLLSPARSADEPLIGGRLEVGGTAATTERLDLLRPTDENILLPRAALNLFLEKGIVIAHAGLTFDRFYSTDPDGLDAARRLGGRSEEAYLGVRTSLASVYLGRYSHHWGAAGRRALIVSGNPRSFDHLFFRLGGGKLTLRSMLGELDNINADDTFTGSDFGPGSRHRYLAAHRLDWRPSPYVTLTLMESTLYSGAQAGPSLKFLNPLHALALVIANKPMNTQQNGFLGLGLWAQYRRLTLYGQFLLDDFDFINGNEPASLAATGAVTLAGPLPAVDLSGSFTLATARAYNSPQPEGDYLYLLRGLALPFTDFVRGGLRANIYLDRYVPGLALRPQVQVLWQGESDLRDPYPTAVEQEVETILVGVVERTVRPALGIFYQPAPWMWLRADAGVNFIQNENHAPGESAVRFEGLVEVGLRLHLSQTLALAW